MKLGEMQLRRMTMKAGQLMHVEGVLCTVAAVVTVDGETAVDVAFNTAVMGLSAAEVQAERQRIGRGVLAALQRSLGEDGDEGAKGGLAS